MFGVQRPIPDKDFFGPEIVLCDGLNCRLEGGGPLALFGFVFLSVFSDLFTVTSCE